MKYYLIVLLCVLFSNLYAQKGKEKLIKYDTLEQVPTDIMQKLQKAINDTTPYSRLTLFYKDSIEISWFYRPALQDYWQVFFYKFTTPVSFWVGYNAKGKRVCSRTVLLEEVNNKVKQKTRLEEIYSQFVTIGRLDISTNELKPKDSLLFVPQKYLQSFQDSIDVYSHHLREGKKVSDYYEAESAHCLLHRDAFGKWTCRYSPKYGVSYYNEVFIPLSLYVIYYYNSEGKLAKITYKTSDDEMIDYFDSEGNVEWTTLGSGGLLTKEYALKQFNEAGYKSITTMRTGLGVSWEAINTVNGSTQCVFFDEYHTVRKPR
jgi:hypothetical protein